jgi:Transposase IS116/IS110/IS902 family
MRHLSAFSSTAFLLFPVARSWRRPFPHCGVASPQAPASDLESPQEAISQSGFLRGKQIGNYVGMIPKENSSAGKQRLGHISKQGN